MGYPKERREAVPKKILPPNNRPIPDLAREEGISEATLYNWRKAALSALYVPLETRNWDRSLFVCS